MATTYTLADVRRKYEKISPDEIYRALMKSHISEANFDSCYTKLDEILTIQRTEI